MNDLVVNPANGHIYVAGADSVYASSDGGATWVRLDGQIPRVRMVQIALAPVTGHLVVATYGRGDWETPAP